MIYKWILIGKTKTAKRVIKSLLCRELLALWNILVFTGVINFDTWVRLSQQTYDSFLCCEACSGIGHDDNYFEPETCYHCGGDGKYKDWVSSSLYHRLLKRVRK